MNFSIEQLNTKQQEAFNLALEGKDLFISGGGGSGKSFLAKFIIKSLSEQGKKVIVTAPTGIASVPLEGTTLHSLLGLGYGPALTENTGKIIVHASKEICLADTILVDEISMVRMDVMDSLLQSVKKAEAKTGSKKQLIVIGDFFQLPPVVTDEDRALLNNCYGYDVRYAYAFQAKAWHERSFIPIILDKIERQNDSMLVSMLNRIRTGDSSNEVLKYFNERVGATIDNPVNLYPYNKQVDSINDKKIDSLPGELYEYHVESDVDKMDYELESLGIPLNLRLKVGAKVIVTINDNDDSSFRQMMFDGFDESHVQKKRRYVNGTMGIVLKCDPSCIYVQVCTEKKNDIVMFTRKEYALYDYIVNDRNELEKRQIGSYYQFPLKVAYALTTHRGQGQTLDSALVDPTSRAPGQLYVALSRCRSIEGLCLVRSIKEYDVKVADEVKMFYEHLNESGYIYPWMPTKATMGRKPKQFARKPIRVYEDLIPTLQAIMQNMDKIDDVVMIHEKAKSLLEKVAEQLSNVDDGDGKD